MYSWHEHVTAAYANANQIDSFQH